MRRVSLPALILATALGACMPPPPTQRPADPAAPSPDLVSRTGAERVVSRWNREAASADRAAVQDTAALLRSARDAMADPRGMDRAMELLERAESRLLTRDTEVGAEGRPMDEGPQRLIANARRSLGGGNRQEALRLVNDALGDLQQEQPRRRS